jgi:hypothetical protein
MKFALAVPSYLETRTFSVAFVFDSADAAVDALTSSDVVIIAVDDTIVPHDVINANGSISRQYSDIGEYVSVEHPSFKGPLEGLADIIDSTASSFRKWRDRSFRFSVETDSNGNERHYRISRAKKTEMVIK